MKSIWVGVRKSERGSGALEYLGIVIVAVLLVGAVVAAVGKFELGEKIACQVQNWGSAQSSCGGESGDGGVVNAWSDQGSDAPMSTPNGKSSPDERSGPEDESDANGPVHFANATNHSEEVDEAKVDGAVDTVKSKTRSGFWFINKTDHDAIREALSSLNGAEINAVLGNLSDAEIREWVNEMNAGWGRGLSEAKRNEVWALIEKKASRQTLERLKGITGRLDVPVGTWADQTDTVRDAESAEVPHELFANGVSIDHVSQQALGDCWVLAPLMGFAEQDPQLIKDAISLNKNGTYNVELYKDGKPVNYTITPEFVVGDSGTPLFVNNKVGEAWPLIMEKAMAEHYGGEYADINGGWPADSMESLTGVKSENHESAPSLQDMDKWLNDGAVITPVSHFGEVEKATYGDPYEGGLVTAHVYVVTEVDSESGLVSLENPWGTNLPTIELSYSEFQESFSSYAVNQGRN